MAKILPQCPQTSHTAQITEYGQRCLKMSVKKRDGTVQQWIVAAGQDEYSLLEWLQIAGVRIIDGLGFNPLFHQMSREKPLPGYFGSRQPFFCDKRINHLFIHIEQTRNFFGVKEGIHRILLGSGIIF